MGLGTETIKFDSGIPPFSEIKSQFKTQTGLHLTISADVNFPLLLNKIEIHKALGMDSEKVTTILKEFEVYKENASKNYEMLAYKRDEANKKLASLFYIKSFAFDIINFYQIDVSVDGNCLCFEFGGNQYYAIQSLFKSLIDLGGSFEDSESLDFYQKRWKKLKPWDEYKWYNRPAK
ncbi:MAG: hypothetical protein U0X91_17420 [Spirosomataceae bacterium]